MALTLDTATVLRKSMAQHSYTRCYTVQSARTCKLRWAQEGTLHATHHSIHHSLHSVHHSAFSSFSLPTAARSHCTPWQSCRDREGSEEMSRGRHDATRRRIAKPQRSNGPPLPAMTRRLGLGPLAQRSSSPSVFFGDKMNQRVNRNKSKGVKVCQGH